MSRSERRSEAEHRFDSDKSKVLFTLKHLGLITVSGHFERFEGRFLFDQEEIGNSFVTLRIKTASLVSDNAKRDAHLKSKKFFWSDKFPEIIFVSRAVHRVNGDTFDIYGELTIRGITRAVTFHTEFLRATGAQARNGHLFFKTYTFIHRKDFNLGTGNVWDPIMLITGETLEIRLEVEGIPLSPDSGHAAIPS